MTDGVLIAGKALVIRVDRALVRSDLALPEEGAYPAVTSVVICTASREITLDHETAAALLERIWRDGGHDHERAENPLLAAINRGGGRVEWSDEAKAAALRALNVWVDKVGAHAVEFPILDLNQELMRDLIDRPFDR